MSKHILVKDLSFTYKNNQQALHNINLKIRHARIHLIIGKNGVGKSTLIKLIAGLFVKKTGIIENTFTKLAYVPDKSHFPANTKVIDYITMLLMVSNNTDRKKVLAHIKTMPNYFNINDLFAKNLHDLSAGQIKKVLLVLAIYGNSDLVILDEPFANLDGNIITELITYFKNMKHKITFVICSHLVQELGEIADDISVFNKGRITYTGSVKNMKKMKGTKNMKTWPALYSYLIDIDNA